MKTEVKQGESGIKAVQVVLPQAKITLEELAYLRGLLPNGVRCACPSDKAISRLKFLGVVKEEKVLPDPEKKRRAEAEVKAYKKDLIAKIRAASYEDWQISRLRKNALPNPSTIVVLTESGRKLLKEGLAVTYVSMDKGGAQSMANQPQPQPHRKAYCHQCGCAYREYRDSVKDGWTSDHSCIEALRERIEQLETQLDAQLDFPESGGA